MKIFFTLLAFLVFSLGVNAKIITLECTKYEWEEGKEGYKKTGFYDSAYRDKSMELISLDIKKKSATIEYPNAPKYKTKVGLLYEDTTSYTISYVDSMSSKAKITINRRDISYKNVDFFGTQSGQCNIPLNLI